MKNFTKAKAESQLGELLSLGKLEALLKAFIRHYSVVPSGQEPGKVVSLELVFSNFPLTCCLLFHCAGNVATVTDKRRKISLR